MNDRMREGGGIPENAAEAGFYWLASYPKSGNTWMRAFIVGLAGGLDVVDINGISTGDMAGSRAWVESALGLDISELSQDEIDSLRPHAYRWIAERMRKRDYHKIHDAYTYLPGGEPLIPPDAALGALYIVRNPLDVAVSFAHHHNCGIDQSIRNMGDPAYAYCGDGKKAHNQLRQTLLSWSGHVESWLAAPGLNRLVLRYEDMRATPVESFAKAARFLGLPHDALSVSRALASCRMEDMQRQEAEKGFMEKTPQAASFFRKGKVGDWVDTLSAAQIRTLLDDHGETMAKLGYLDAGGNPAGDAHAASRAGLTKVDTTV